MTSYENMDAVDLRAELTVWRIKALKTARAYRELSTYGDFALTGGIGLRLDQELAHIKHIENLLELGVVA